MTDWSEIIGRHGQVVWHTAYRLLANHADASDCYQKTFLDAVRAAERETVRDWPTFLRRLATARALDFLRVRYRNAGCHEPLADPSAVISHGPGPQASAEAGELAEQLRAAPLILRREAFHFVGFVCRIAGVALQQEELLPRLRHTDDFPNKSTLPVAITAENRRCYPLFSFF